MRKFWNWKNLDGETPERVLELNGTIADESWFEDDITPRMFKEELFAGSGNITIWINSPGGDCVAASQIYSMLMDYSGNVTVKIDGIAASAASVIAMAGDAVLMSPTALMMIHNPSTAAFGDHRDMQRAIELLDEVKQSIINAYEIKTGQSRAVLSHLMENETWMNARKAVELGFADGILESEKKVAPEAFMFSSRETDNAMWCRLTAAISKEKAKGIVVKEVATESTEAKEEAAKPEGEKPNTPGGRKVWELKNELQKIKKFI